MLEIARGRPWKVVHTVADEPEGNLSDLSTISFQSQIRAKTGSRGTDGVFRNELIADVQVDVDLSSSQVSLSLPLETVNGLRQGTYQIDLIGHHLETGYVETFLEPEDLVVANRPTGGFDASGSTSGKAVTYPDFSQQFTDQLS